MQRRSFLTRTIWIVGLVSLFTDISSEMLYPVMPVYLQSIGFTALWIGFMEGFAEAIVGISKGYFGHWSDHKGKRVILVRAGYFLSSLSKPLLSVFSFPVWVFSVRTMDRFGKGMRTSARDALLSDECSSGNKGKVFGFHRSMDTIGAAIGPVMALVFLFYYPNTYKPLFLIAFIPAIFSVGLTFLLKEKITPSNRPSRKFKPFGFLTYWKTANLQYRKLIFGLLMFALINSSDMFLLLKVKNTGASDLHVIALYIFYNLVYAVFSYPMGALADKAGMKIAFILGLLMFSVVYGGIAFAESTVSFYALFFLYGIFSAGTEGVSKAWISKITPPGQTATAIGFYSWLASVAALIASSATGLVWVSVSPFAAMMVSAAIAVAVAGYIFTLKESGPEQV